MSYRYNFYTGNLVIYLDRANIIQGMKRLQAYRYELMPNGDQLRDMRRFSGSCRFVYNKALALQKENHAADNKFIGYVAMAAKLPSTRAITVFCCQNLAGCVTATAVMSLARCVTSP